MPNIIVNLKEKFKQEKSIEANVHSVLMSSTVGRLSSVGIHLDYSLMYVQLNPDCCKETLFSANVLNIDPQKQKYK